MIRAFANLALALWLALGAAVAQDVTAPNYERWAEVATRAEETLAGAQASDLALSALRSELVRFRGVFLAAENTNKDRIKTATDQLAALGAAPADGAAEPPEIATRRKELTDQLAKLNAPVLAAVEAFQRADGLIKEIDKLIRERQTQRLLERGPAPVNPANWAVAGRELSEALRGLKVEFQEALAREQASGSLQKNTPGAIAFALIGTLLILYSWTIWRRARDYARSALGWRMVGPVDVVSSLLTVALPMLGVQAWVNALSLVSLMGFRGAHIVEGLPDFGLTLFSAVWLASRVFPATGGTSTMLRLDSRARRTGRRAAFALGLSYVALLLVGRLDRFEDFSAVTHAVAEFPALLAAALCLLFLGQLLDRHAAALAAVAEAAGETRGRASAVVGVLRWAVLAIGVLGPIIGAMGFMPAALALVFPVAMTIGLFALLAIAQGLVGDFYVLLTRSEEEAREGLIPVLIGLALITAAIPALALIWGMRWVELTELWTTLAKGVAIGQTRISVSDFLTFVLVFSIGYVITRALQATMRTSVLPKTSIDPGGRTAIVSGIGYVGVFLAALAAVTATGIDLSSLAIVAGALSVGIGFGLQNIVSNFVSGIILLIERPISEGDWIEVGGNTGIVKSISVRSTQIETFDRTDVIVPNLDLVSGTVTNWTRGNTVGRLTIRIGVAYGTDTRHVEKVLAEVARMHEVVLSDPPPKISFDAFGADSLDFAVRVYLRDVNRLLDVRTELNHQIAARFAQEGIEIPFAQRDIWIRNPEALRGRPEEKKG